MPKGIFLSQTNLKPQSSATPPTDPPPTGTPSGTSFILADFSAPTSITTNGDAAYVANALRLTPDASMKTGSAFRTTPVNFAAGASFKTRFRAKIGGAKDVFGGVGFAFVLHNAPTGAATLGGTEEYFGYYGTPNSVAVKINTLNVAGSYHNNSIEIHTNVPTDQIVRSVNMNPGLKAAADCSKYVSGSYLNLNAPTINVWVEYNGVAKRLYVYMSKTATKPTEALLNHEIDLSTVVGNQGYIGFTAATEEKRWWNYHDILDWEFQQISGSIAAPTSTFVPPSRPAFTSHNKPFLMGQWIKYANIPAGTMNGLTYFEFHGQQEYWASDPAYDTVNFPNETKTKARAALRGQQNAPLYYYNIEFLEQSSVPVENETKKYCAVANWTLQETPNINVGYYGVIPRTNQYAYLNWSAYQQQHNQKLPILQYVNYLMADLYFNDESYSEWSNWAERTYTETRRIATLNGANKPCYAIMMPRYNIGAEPASIRMQLLPPQYWRDCLNRIYNLGFDGVIIWDYAPGDQWSSTANLSDPNNWWAIVREFMTQKGL